MKKNKKKECYLFAVVGIVSYKGNSKMQRGVRRNIVYAHNKEDAKTLFFDYYTQQHFKVIKMVASQINLERGLL